MNKKIVFASKTNTWEGGLFSLILGEKYLLKTLNDSWLREDKGENSVKYFNKLARENIGKSFVSLLLKKDARKSEQGSQRDIYKWIRASDQPWQPILHTIHWLAYLNMNLYLLKSLKMNVSTV